LRCVTVVADGKVFMVSIVIVVESGEVDGEMDEKLFEIKE